MAPRTAATRPPDGNGLLARLVERGPYFTDGVRLFRHMGTVRGSSGPRLMQLEDCRTLEVSDFTEEEAMVLGLKPVAPAPPPEGQPPRGTARTGAGLSRTSPEDTPPSSTRRTGP